jgi:tripartite-type tricarboxylate transporter receptor subunit TctC
MTHSETQRTRRKLIAGLALCALAPAAMAQASWPTKPITLIVPFAPGGSTDVVARLLGQKLGEMWHQQVVVDNRAGAGGNIGTALVANAKPDGYTLVMASGSILTVNPHLYQKLPFDPKALTPITMVASGPMVVVVPTSSDVKSVKELIAKAKAAPGTINFGSAGLGSQVHMAGEKFAYAAGVDLVHIPYKGEALAYSDLMAGQIQVVVGNIAAISSLVGDNRLRALAVTSKERSKIMPNVPTLDESGLPGFENSGWFGLLAPTGTPKDVVERIQRDTATVLNQPEVRAQLLTQGMSSAANSPAAFTQAIEAESKGWAEIIKKRNLSVN